MGIQSQLILDSRRRQEGFDSEPINAGLQLDLSQLLHLLRIEHFFNGVLNLVKLTFVVVLFVFEFCIVFENKLRQCRHNFVDQLLLQGEHRSVGGFVQTDLCARGRIAKQTHRVVFHPQFVNAPNMSKGVESSRAQPQARHDADVAFGFRR